MKKTTTFLATTLFCLTLGACATTDDTPKTVEGTDSHQIPSHAARQNDVAYSDISSNATITEVATVDKTVDASTASVENPPVATTDTWSSTSNTTGTTGMTSGSTSSSTGTVSSSTSSSTTGSSTSTDPNWTDGSKIDTSMASSSNVSQDTQSSTSSTDDTSATSTRTRMRKD